MARKPNPDRYIITTRQGYARAKCQADFRHEVWDLSLEQWLEFWTRERWPQRGRDSLSICMTRRDNTQPWNRQNCCIIKRCDAIRVAKAYQAGRIPDPEIWNRATFLE